MGINQSLDAPTRGTNSFFRLETWLFANSLLDSLSEDSRGEPVEGLVRIFHELVSRDRGEGCATGQPQWIGSEAYLNSRSHGPIPEDARLPAHRAYSSERRTVISAVAVTPGRDEISGLGLKRGVVDTMSKPARKRDRFLAVAYSRSQKISE